MSNHHGPSIMIGVLALIVLVMVGGALSLSRPAAGPGGARGAGGAQLAFQVTFARTAQGIAATVVATNRGTEDLKDLTITRASVASMTGGGPLPLAIPKLPRGAATSMTFPFSGIAPAANAPLSLDLAYEYRFGLFGKGSGSSGVSSIIP